MQNQTSQPHDSGCHGDRERITCACRLICRRSWSLPFYLSSSVIGNPCTRGQYQLPPPSLSLAAREAIPIGIASKCPLTEKTHENTDRCGNACRVVCVARVGAKVKARFHRRAVRLRSANQSRVARRRHEWSKRPNHVGRFCQRERSRSIYQGIDGPWIRKYGRPLTA